jgi:hypothetical protein
VWLAQLGRRVCVCAGPSPGVRATLSAAAQPSRCGHCTCVRVSSALFVVVYRDRNRVEGRGDSERGYGLCGLACKTHIFLQESEYSE